MSRGMLIVAAALLALAGGVASGAEAQGPADTKEQFVLTGVVFVEGGRGLAWLQEPRLTQNQSVLVRPGETVGPYRLTKILADRVELEGPGGTLVVPLHNTLRGAPDPATASVPSEAARPGRGRPTTAPTAATPEAPSAMAPAPAGPEPFRSRPAAASTEPDLPPPAAGPEPPRPAASRPVDLAVSAPSPPAQGKAPIIIQRGDPRRKFTGFR